MAKELQVSCINKLNRNDDHEGITHIGNGTTWRLSRPDAIRRIESKEEAFYTVDKTTGKKAYVGVVKPEGRLPYLRTHADGKWNDNLLAQPECSGSCPIVG